MKNPILIFLLILLFTLHLSAQKHTIRISDEIKFKRGNFVKHLHTDTSGHYLLFSKKKKKEYIPIIRKFDNNFEPIFIKEFLLKKGKIKNLGMKYFGGKFTWMFYQKDKKKKTYDIYIIDISLKGKSSKPRKITTLKYEKKNPITYLKWEISPDTTKILFVAQFDNNRKKDVFKAYVCVMDQDLNKIFDRKIVMKKTQREFSTLIWGMTNSAVHFLGITYDNDRIEQAEKSNTKANRRLDNPNYTISFYQFKNATDTFSKINLDLNESFYRGVRLIKDDQSNLIGAGVFSASTKGPILGTFYFKIDKNNNLVYQNKTPFTKDEISYFGKRYTKRQRKTKLIGLDATFGVNNILLNDDGSFNVTIEDNYSYIESVGRSSSYTVKHYVSNFILFTKVNIMGEQQSISLIPKRQDITNTNKYGSHSIMKTKNNTFFLYNDHKNNFKGNAREPENFKKLRGSSMAVSVIAHFENGKLIRKKLFSAKDFNIFMYPNKGKQISDNKILFFGWERSMFENGHFKFGSITIN